LSAPFDTRGPRLLLRRAAHHELARRQVEGLQRDAVSEVEPLGVARLRFGGVERGQRHEQQCGEDEPVKKWAVGLHGVVFNYFVLESRDSGGVLQGFFTRMIRSHSTRSSFAVPP